MGIRVIDLPSDPAFEIYGLTSQHSPVQSSMISSINTKCLLYAMLGPGACAIQTLTLPYMELIAQGATG